MATREATRLGYDVTTMEVEADDANTAWTEYTADMAPGYGDFHPGLRERLARGDFWAVYWGPRESQLGGDLWVFVCKRDLTILDVVRGR